MKRARTESKKKKKKKEGGWHRGADGKVGVTEKAPGEGAHASEFRHHPKKTRAQVSFPRHALLHSLCALAVGWRHSTMADAEISGQDPQMHEFRLA